MTAAEVAAITRKGRHAVGGISGLLLHVDDHFKSWVLRYYHGGKRHDLGLGAYPAVSLKQAREKALNQRAQLQNGIDPLHERVERRLAAREAVLKSKTFRECAELYIEAHRPEWKNAKHAEQWERSLSVYADPFIGRLPVSTIDTGHVLAVLQQKTRGRKGVEGMLWLVKNETAARLRGRIENILDFAAFRKLRAGENPARWTGHLEHELPAASKVQKIKHHASLPHERIGAFMAELRARTESSARALELIILTAARSADVRHASWDEFDLDKKVWTIPAERMKLPRPHRVPLSKAALRLLHALPKSQETNLLFPGDDGESPYSDAVFMALYDRMGVRGKITTHGFRSTFRDWGGEMTNYPRDVMEYALAHKEPDATVEAYARSDLFGKRARMMEDWGNYCDTLQPPQAEIIPINHAA
jgi:integrase